MAYKNKKSAKRKHRKYRRRSKKGGVITYNRNPNNLQATRKHQHVDESVTIRKLADSVTEKALANALSTFSRQQQAPPINVTVHGKSRAKREGPTPGQIKKAEQKALKEQEKALKKQLKEQEKALKKAQKEAQKEEQKEEAKKQKEHTKVAKDVTKSAIDEAFSSMFGFGKGTGPKSRRRRK